MAVILHSFSSAGMNALARRAAIKLAEAGIAVFPSVSRAALAISKFARHHVK